MADTEPDSVWTKPRQSFKLKKVLSKGRPAGLGGNGTVGNRTLPNFSTQAGKRRNPFSLNDSDSVLGDGAKRQRLGDIFSPASVFRERKLSLSKLGSDCSTQDSVGRCMKYEILCGVNEQR